MNNIVSQAHEGAPVFTEARPFGKALAGGSIGEIIGSAGAVVLSILGLCKVFPAELAAVAVIALGVSLAFEGGAIGSRFSRLLAATGSEKFGAVELGGGVTAEFLGGAAGIILGLLALLNVEAAILVPVAAIVLGGALIVGSGATGRLNFLEIVSRNEHQRMDSIAHGAISAAVGGQILTGLAAVLLGILALVGFNPLVLSLVAFLSIGASLALSGAAIGSRVFSLLVG